VDDTKALTTELWLLTAWSTDQGQLNASGRVESRSRVASACRWSVVICCGSTWRVRGGFGRGVVGLACCC